MSLLHQNAEVLHEQCTQQRSDMQAVRIGVGKNADLAVTQTRQVIRGRINADCHGNIMHLLRSQDFTGGDLPGIEDFPAQGHHGLELAITRLLGRAPGGITLHQKQFGAGDVGQRAIRQFSRQRRTRGDFLARHLLALAQPFLGIINGQFSEFFRHIGVLVQVQRKRILHHTRNKAGRLARRQTLLGLAGELRILHLQGNHKSAAIPDILG